MKTAEVVEALSAEIIRIRDDAELRMSALQVAIELIQGGPRPPETNGLITLRQYGTPAPASNRAPSVTEMVEAAAREMGDSTVLDNGNLKTKISEMFQGKDSKVKTGIYNAVKQLINRGVLKRCPGGFNRGPRFNEGDGTRSDQQNNIDADGGRA